MGKMIFYDGKLISLEEYKNIIRNQTIDEAIEKLLDWEENLTDMRTIKEVLQGMKIEKKEAMFPFNKLGYNPYQE